MMEEKKPKHKILRTVKEGDMIKVDERTYQTKDYMIYNSDRLGWLCDCKDFMFNSQKKKGYECKHIKRAQAP